MKSVRYDLATGSATQAPELFYQERAEWQIVLLDGESPADISCVAAWGAAVAADFCAGTAPMCRTLSENISVDAQTATLTIPLDCATPEFLAAVRRYR